MCSLNIHSLDFAGEYSFSAYIGRKNKLVDFELRNESKKVDTKITKSRDVKMSRTVSFDNNVYMKRYEKNSDLSLPSETLCVTQRILDKNKTWKNNKSKDGNVKFLWMLL